MSYRSVFTPGLFNGRTVVVTGGGSGIGRCTAHEIAALGAHVAICGRKKEKVDAAAEKLRARGITVSAHACDIREVEQIASFVDAVKNELTLGLPLKEIKARQKAWKPRKSKETRGTLAKYAKLVTSASEGAVTDVLDDLAGVEAVAVVVEIEEEVDGVVAEGVAGVDALDRRERDLHAGRMAGGPRPVSAVRAGPAPGSDPSVRAV